MNCVAGDCLENTVYLFRDNPEFQNPPPANSVWLGVADSSRVEQLEEENPKTPYYFIAVSQPAPPIEDGYVLSSTEFVLGTDEYVLFVNPGRFVWENKGIVLNGFGNSFVAFGRAIVENPFSTAAVFGTAVGLVLIWNPLGWIFLAAAGGVALNQFVSGGLGYANAIELGDPELARQSLAQIGGGVGDAVIVGALYGGGNALQARYLPQLEGSNFGLILHMIDEAAYGVKALSAAY